MTGEPVFAVVGHPNKGKSSLVASLARDASVAIGPDPGTTVKARRFPLRVDGRTLYTLVDTPGFQRPRAVLEWLEELEATAADRAAAVREFLHAHRSDPRFSAECELLTPIAQGAGILYVVDGAVPYAPEYDAEMEILRWTGQPSIAVINPIGGEAYVADWSRALSQYFRVVRVLDALDAPFEKRLQVLSAFAELAEDWRAPLQEAVATLRAERAHAVRESARALADLVSAAVDLTVEQRIPATAPDPAGLSPALEALWQDRLRRLEGRCRARVEALYHHERLERREPALEAAEEDLFSQDTWVLFGLSRADLAKAGAAGGALAGLGVDAATGGGSMLLGTVAGAVMGAAGGWLSAGALAKLSIKRLPLGERVARYGPSRNPNLLFVLMGRARIHHRSLAGRSHAHREALDLERQGQLNPLDEDTRATLAGAFARVRRAGRGSARRAEAVAHVAAIIEDILKADLQLPAPPGGDPPALP